MENDKLDKAQVDEAHRQATELIRGVVTPMFEEQSKAIGAQMKAAVDELAKAIPVVVNQVIEAKIAEERRAETAVAVAPPLSQPSAAVAPAAPGDNRLATIMGIAQMLGIAGPQANDPLAMMERFFGMNAKLNELVSAQNNQLLQGIQLASTVIRGSVSAGGDPEKAANALGDAFKSKPSAQAAATKISLNGGDAPA